VLPELFKTERTSVGLGQSSPLRHCEHIHKPQVHASLSKVCEDPVTMGEGGDPFRWELTA